jgi:hypothetical protein
VPAKNKSLKYTPVITQGEAMQRPKVRMPENVISCNASDLSYINITDKTEPYNQIITS